MKKIIICISVFIIVGCKKSTINDDSSIESFVLPKTSTGVDPGFIYTGPMVPMKEVELFLSFEGRSLRVQGVPIKTHPDWNEAKFMAQVADPKIKNRKYIYPNGQDPNTGEDRFFVVYPIAIPASLSDRESVGHYKFTRVVGHRSPTDHSWHGLPFMAYRGNIAFHSPITFRNGETGHVAKQGEILELYRGEVSAGCKRMQAEHIMELARIFDVKTTVKLNSYEDKGVAEEANLHGKGTKGFIHVMSKFDEIKGKIVDMDYNRFDTNTSNFNVPAGKSVQIYNTWDLGDSDKHDVYTKTLVPVGDKSFICYFEKLDEVLVDQSINWNKCYRLNAKSANKDIVQTPTPTKKVTPIKVPYELIPEQLF